MHSSAVERRIADPEVAGSIPVAPFPSRLAQLVERKTLNLVVVGSSPTVGRLGAHGATAARRIPDPKVGGSNPSGLIIFCVLRFALLGGRITHKGGPPCSTFISHFFAQVGYLPGRGVSLIKKGLRLVWSRIIAL